MVGESEVVLDRDGTAAAMQAEARELLAAGPGPLLAAERDAMRYGLSDLLDDLVGCRTSAELPWIAGLLLAQTAQLALAAAGEWGGSGKALHRALAAHDPGLAARLVDGHRAVVAEGAVEGLRDVVLEVLDRVGGPLVEGYRVGGPPDVAAARRAPRCPTARTGATCWWRSSAARGAGGALGRLGRPVGRLGRCAGRRGAEHLGLRDPARGVPRLGRGGSAPACSTAPTSSRGTPTSPTCSTSSAAGLPVVPSVLAKTPDEARAAAAGFGSAVCKPTIAASGRGLVVLDRPG